MDPVEDAESADGVPEEPGGELLQAVDAPHPRDRAGYRAAPAGRRPAAFAA